MLIAYFNEMYFCFAAIVCYAVLLATPLTFKVRKQAGFFQLAATIEIADGYTGSAQGVKQRKK